MTGEHENDRTPAYGARVRLPEDCATPTEVFVNGVAQRAGHDYDRRGRDLMFRAALRHEGRLGLIRWLSIALAVAGTYRQNDSVDVTYEAGGRSRVATGLPIETLVDDESTRRRGTARGSYSPG